MHVAKQAPWISRDVVGLALNRFLSDFGHEAGTAILPLFLAATGAPAVALGAIEAVSDGLSSFAKLFGGWWGDHVLQRRPWAALAYALTGITTGLYAVASAWPGVLAARALGWAGRGFRSPLHDAMLADVVPVEARGRAFGLDEAADTLGAIAGPSAALAVVALVSQTKSTLTAYRIVFLLAVIPGILAAASILFLVREDANRCISTLSFRGSLRALPVPFRRYLVGIGIFGAGDYSHTLLILYAAQVLADGRTQQQADSMVVQLYTLHNVLYAAGAYPLGVLADRIGKGGLLVGAYILAAFMSALLIAGGSSALLPVIFAIGGAVYASQQSLERAIAADLVPAESRSVGFGTLATVNGIGDFVSSLTVGMLWTVFSPAVGFAYSLTLSLAGAAVMAIVLKSNKV